MGEFRKFLLVEQEEFLAQKIGDVLTSLQGLADDGNSVGNRQLIRWSEKVVDQMRKILDGNWPKDEEPHLRVVQRVAVALAKAIDNNEKMSDIVVGATAELEKLQSKLGSPIHDLEPAAERKGSDKE